MPPARALGPSPTCIRDTLTDPAEPKCALTGVGASCWEGVNYSTWSSAEWLLQLLQLLPLFLSKLHLKITVSPMSDESMALFSLGFPLSVKRNMVPHYRRFEE